MVRLSEFESVYNRLENLELKFNASRARSAQKKARLRLTERRATTTRLMVLNDSAGSGSLDLKSSNDDVVTDNILFEQLGPLCPLAVPLAHPHLVAEEKRRGVAHEKLRTKLQWEIWQKKTC